MTTPGCSKLHPFASGVAALAYVLICAGALVTSTGSSLSVPDWPLSFGTLFPPMLGGVLFEHSHRLIAGTVAVLTLILAVGAYKKESDPLVRGLIFTAAGGIVVQAVLGGVTVLMRLPPAVSIAHACLGQSVFCLLLAAAQASSPWYRASQTLSSGLTTLGAWGVLAVFTQLALGAYLRHTGAGFVFHMGWAVVAAATLLVLGFAGIRKASLRVPSALLLGLVPAQLALGYASYRVKFSPDFETGLHLSTATTAVHVAVGAALFGASVLWLLRARKTA